jgi:hypothetical protein
MVEFAIGECLRFDVEGFHAGGPTWPAGSKGK